jgi:hypothetical protein
MKNQIFIIKKKQKKKQNLEDISIVLTTRRTKRNSQHLKAIHSVGERDEET